jgi:glucosamine 6-phosphate synthetase-like amidotransferase/phosphosugar isomerase protein
VRLRSALEDVERGAYEDFMEKEITERPPVVARLLGRLLPQAADGSLWKKLHLPWPLRLRFVASGHRCTPRT